MFWPQFFKGQLLLLIETVFLLLFGQKTKNLGCDWFIQLSNNSILLLALADGYAARLRKNGVLNEPIRLEEIVIIIIIIILKLMMNIFNCINLNVLNLSELEIHLIY